MKQRIQCFEDFEVWKKAMNLVVQIYACMKPCDDHAFRNQIQRAAVSIPSNFSEGYERNTHNEFIRFINIANASNAEVRTLLYLSIKLKYINDSKATDLINQTREISAMLIKLREYRRGFKGGR